MTTGITKQNVENTIKLVSAVGQAIVELREVPEGHLYAQLMAHMSLEQFQAILRILKQNKIIEIKGHLIKSLI